MSRPLPLPYYSQPYLRICGTPIVVVVVVVVVAVVVEVVCSAMAVDRLW